MNDLKFAFRQLLKTRALPPWPCLRARWASERTGRSSALSTVC